MTSEQWRNRTDEHKIRRRLEKKGKDKQRVRTKVTGKEEGGGKEEGKGALGLGASQAVLHMFPMKFIVTHLTGCGDSYANYRIFSSLIKN